jgi:ubiquinone biosynthesis protein UbiJ
VADDIITRLQEMLDGPVPFVIGREDIREAADEIERLRAEVDTLSKVIRRLNGDGVIYFRDKAVRRE